MGPYAGQFPAGYLPRHDFAARDRQGPSVLDQAERCMRSWGLRYLVGFDSQEPEWSDISDHVYDPPSRTWRGVSVAGAYTPVPSRKRSTALGTESHRIAGAFYEGKPSVPGYKTWAEAWASFPGQVAQAWLDVMPAPDECDQVFSELPVALYPNPDGEELPGGLVLEGTSDLLLRVRPDAGPAKFNNAMVNVLFESDQWVAADFKTTRDWRYQKDAATLRTDKQGVIYLLAAMRRLDLEAMPGRWAYSITDVRKRREARATDFVQTREHAETAVAGYFRQAAVLKGHHRAFAGIKAGGDCTADAALADRLAYAQALPADTSRCDDFGGCPHSWERGGACTARRLLSDRTPKAAAAPDVPLASLLERSLSEAKTTGPKGPSAADAAGRVVHMSIWKQRAEQFRAANAAVPAIAAGSGILAAEARASVALDGETRSVEAGDSTGLELEPVAPQPAAAPRGRGRPAGAKNKPKAGVAQAAAAAYEAEASDAGQGGIISEIAARELLNTPLPPGAVPGVELARISELAGWNAVPADAILDATSTPTPTDYAADLALASSPPDVPDHPPCPPTYTLPLYDVGFTRDGASFNEPSCVVTLRVPRHRVAAAAEAIDAIVAAVFPSPERSGS